MAGLVACMRNARYAYRMLVVKPKGKIPLGRPRRRCENNTKVDVQEVG
jgi:hypothetical protein